MGTEKQGNLRTTTIQNQTHLQLFKLNVALNPHVLRVKNPNPISNLKFVSASQKKKKCSLMSLKTKTPPL